MYNSVQSRLPCSGESSIDDFGGGDIHIFMLADAEDNRYQTKWIMQNINIWKSPPPPINDAGNATAPLLDEKNKITLSELIINCH